MKLLDSAKDFYSHAEESVVTIGVFDGVHRGHQVIISNCVSKAKMMNLPSVVLTFDQNPRKVVFGESPCVITSKKRKLKLIEELAVDYTVVLRFDQQLSSMTPEEFCRKILVRNLGARLVCVGENFHFGFRGSGDVKTLAGEGARLGFNLDVVHLIRTEKGTISSSLIRKLISDGLVNQVMETLGRPYDVTGKVITGHSRGKSLGFPTANLDLDRNFCVPIDGVYAGKAMLSQDNFLCAINIGSSPTFGDADRSIEAFLVDFKGDIYGETLDIEFHHRLRDEIAFAGSECLMEQIEKDIEKTRDIMGDAG